MGKKILTKPFQSIVMCVIVFNLLQYENEIIFPGFKVMTALLDPGGEDLQYSALKFLLQHTDPLAQKSINQNRQACKTELSDHMYNVQANNYA